MTTLTFTSTTNKSVTITDQEMVNQDTDTDSTGKTIGFDTTYIAPAGTTSATADAALAIDGGLLYATFSTTDGQSWTGEVTGGTGKFKGVTGKVSAKAQSETALEVTVNYS
jgi:hypothetical protein